MSIMFEMMSRDKKAKDKLREKFPGVPLNGLGLTIPEKEQLLQFPLEKLNERQKEALKKLELNYELAQTIGRKLDRMYSIEDATYYCENKEIFKSSFVQYDGKIFSAENLVNELDKNGYQPLDAKVYGNKTIIVCRKRTCKKKNKYEVDINYEIKYISFLPENPEVFTSVVKKAIEKLPPYAQRVSKIPYSCSEENYETLEDEEYEAFDRLYNSKLLKLSCEVVNTFYSKSMKEHFFEHPTEFTIGQLATLAVYHMKSKKVSQFLKALSEESDISEEKAYLESAAEEWSNEDWSKTYDLFEKYQKAVGDSSGRAIFCEKCQLPVFAKRGDPVIFKCGNELLYGVVFHSPDYKKHEGFDYSDECYGIYSLEDKSPGLVYPWQIQDYCPVQLPDVEVIPTYALPKKKKEHLYQFVRDMALLDLLTDQDWENLGNEYEKNGHKQILLKELIEKRDSNQVYEAVSPDTIDRVSRLIKKHHKLINFLKDK